jgi:hypothetical protein
MTADYIKGKLDTASDIAHTYFLLSMKQFKERNKLEHQHHGPSVSSIFLDKMGRRNSDISQSIYAKKNRISTIAFKHMKKRHKSTGYLFYYGK